MKISGKLPSWIIWIALLGISGLIFACNLPTKDQAKSLDEKAIEETTDAIVAQITAAVGALPPVQDLIQPTQEVIIPTVELPPELAPEVAITPRTPPQSPAGSKENFPDGAVEKKGMKAIALAVEDPANLSGAYTPSDGMHVVAVQILLENMGYQNFIDQTDTFNISPNSSFWLYAEAYEVPCNVVYDANQVIHADQLSAMDIKTGEQAKGWVLFEVPDGDKAASVALINEIDAPILSIQPLPNP